MSEPSVAVVEVELVSVFAPVPVPVVPSVETAPVEPLDAWVSASPEGQPNDARERTTQRLQRRSIGEFYRLSGAESSSSLRRPYRSLVCERENRTPAHFDAAPIHECSTFDERLTPPAGELPVA